MGKDCQCRPGCRPGTFPVSSRRQGGRHGPLTAGPAPFLIVVPLPPRLPPVLQTGFLLERQGCGWESPGAGSHGMATVGSPGPLHPDHAVGVGGERAGSSRVHCSGRGGHGRSQSLGLQEEGRKKVGQRDCGPPWWDPWGVFQVLNWNTVR